MADNWRQNPNQRNSPKSREQSRRRTQSAERHSPRDQSHLFRSAPQLTTQSHAVVYEGDPQLDLSILSPTAFVDSPVSPVRVGSPTGGGGGAQFVPRAYQPVPLSDDLSQLMAGLHIGGASGQQSTPGSVQQESSGTQPAAQDILHQPTLPPPPQPAWPSPLPVVSRPQVPGIDNTDWDLMQGRYEFVARIGAGNFGQVYEGWSNWTTDKVAIKIQKVTPGLVFIESLRDEKYVCDKLNYYGHKNLMTIMDTLLDRDRLYIVSELSPIGDLHQYMQVTNAQNQRVWQPLEIYEAWHLGHGIAEGVAYLHHHNVAHGDIKPENVLLFFNPEPMANSGQMTTWSYDTFIPKLTDFGNVAIRLKSHPPGKILCNYPKCSIPYAAPESWGAMIGGNVREYDCLPADCYSFGCCLISMVLGCQPFQVSNDLLTDIKGPTKDMQKAYKAFVGLKQDQTYLKSMVKPLPVTLRSLLTNLLDPRPEPRMTIDQILADPWMVRPDLRMFEDSHQRKPNQFSRKDRNKSF